jgi:hypothetical protein
MTEPRCDSPGRRPLLDMMRSKALDSKLTCFGNANNILDTQPLVTGPNPAMPPKRSCISANSQLP